MSDLEDTMSVEGIAAGAAPRPPKARLKCLDPSRLREPANALEIRLTDGPVSIGRAAENDILVNAEGVSKSHARISPVAGQWEIEDLGSTNGVRVNNSKVPKSVLADGDNVSIGRALYKFEIDATPEAKPAAAKIDIGDGEKTVMISRGSRPAAAPAPAKTGAAPGAAKPGGAKPADAAPAAAPKPPGARPAARKAAAKSAGGIGIVMWVIVVLGAAALVGAVVMMLGG